MVEPGELVGGLAALLVVAGHVGHQGLGLDPAVLADLAVLDLAGVEQPDQEGPADVEELCRLLGGDTVPAASPSPEVIEAEPV